MKKITLDDLAKETKLSKTTISRVLTGKSSEYRINSETRDAVINAAQRLNYKPGQIAQLLRKNSSYTIGVAVPDLSNPFFASLASAITVEAKKKEIVVILFDTQESVQQEEEAIAKMLQHKVDGIIIAPCCKSAAYLEKINKSCPVVLVDRYFNNSTLPYVSTNNFKGAYDAMSLLLEAGHRKIVCIQGPHFSSTNTERIRGCQTAIKDYGIPCDMCTIGSEFSVQNGYIETEFMLNHKPYPTAIFAFSNTIMLGALKSIKEHGLSIPNDISLVSFDENLFLDFLNPPITRVAQPTESIGIAAIKLIDNCLQTNTSIHSVILLAPTIIKGKSIRNIN